MAKRLIVAEKPSVGRDIAKVLNCRENGSGCCIGQNDIVTWAVGHLVGLCSPDELDYRYAEWKLEDLPIFPKPFRLKVLESTEKQYQIVSSLMNDPGVDRIVCATDAGREGELIFRYIYQMAECTKPVERLWISSLTFRAIKEGFENLKPASEYDKLYESARCRSEADWLIGMNGSRAYAVVNDMRMLSVGRVLSPTLAILVKRELEIRNFIPEKFCELVATFDGYTGRLLNSAIDDPKDCTRFPASMQKDLQSIENKHALTGTVILSESEPEQQPPQLLYDLTSLQRDANRLFGMSSKWTLDTAQSLYEKHKAITYPRTDSRYLSSDIKSTLPKRLQSLMEGELEQYAIQAFISKRDLFGRFINDSGVSDHHAIIPTGEAKGIEHWSKQEKQIYDLICRRFIGMFFPDREVLHHRIETAVDGKVFLTLAEEELAAGWSAVDKSRKRKSQQLPNVKQNSRIKVLGMRVRTDQTSAPPPHTEASLLAAMEHAGRIVSGHGDEDTETEFGIGTPATRAATIEKMLEKEMAVRKGKALIPTEYGIKLISILPEVLQSPEMTGEWEAKLARISKGEESPEQFMQGIRQLTREVIGFAMKQGNTGIKEAKSLGACPLCGSPVREYDWAYYCANRNCAFRQIRKAEKGFHPTLQTVVMRELLANGVADTEKGTFKLIKTFPYISFVYAPKPIPDYKALHELIGEYGLTPVNKVIYGGALWVRGDRDEELVRDFIRDSRKTGCIFEYSSDSKALWHRSGWYHRVEPEYYRAFGDAFGIKPSSFTGIQRYEEKESDPVIGMIRESGFSYVDKRPNGGSLWIIAGQKDGKELIDRCRKYDLHFEFTEKGGKASNHQPAWYSV